MKCVSGGAPAPLIGGGVHESPVPTPMRLATLSQSLPWLTTFLLGLTGLVRNEVPSGLPPECFSAMLRESHPRTPTAFYSLLDTYRAVFGAVTVPARGDQVRVNCASSCVPRLDVFDVRRYVRHYPLAIGTAVVVTFQDELTHLCRGKPRFAALF